LITGNKFCSFAIITSVAGDALVLAVKQVAILGAGGEWVRRSPNGHSRFVTKPHRSSEEINFSLHLLANAHLK
jgi:hypothetical protein